MVNKEFDVGYSGCRHGPTCAEKCFGQNRRLPNFFGTFFDSHDVLGPPLQHIKNQEYFFLIWCTGSQKKKSWKKNLGFQRMLGPDDTQGDTSQNILFTKQTSMMFLTIDHFSLFIFWLNLPSRVIRKKFEKCLNLKRLQPYRVSLVAMLLSSNLGCSYKMKTHILSLCEW